VNTISPNPHVQSLYEQSLRNGCSPKLAEMLAFRQAPGTKGTDRSFLEGRHNDLGFGKMRNDMQEFYVRRAKEHGVSVEGKVYESGLARFPGDPKAWVSSVGEVQAICREQNLTCTGAVEYQGHEVAPIPDCPLSEQLIRENMVETLAKEPGKKRDLREVREEVIAKHGAPARAKGKVRHVE
jgi:hypothetical protein